MYKTKEDLHKRVQEHYEEASKHGEIFGVFLEGSQNYVDNLFFQDSDVDTVAIIVPQKRDILLGLEFKTQTIALENEEHVELFDLRTYFKTLKKTGINSQQTLFTEYFKVNEKYKADYEKLLKIRENIAKADMKKLLMSIMGVSDKNFKYLTKSNGQQNEEIESYGFSKKRLANILRYSATIKALLAGETFEKSLKALDEKKIFEIRKTDKYVNEYSLEEILEMAQKVSVETMTLAKEYEHESVDYETLKMLDEILYEVLLKKLELTK